MGQLLFPFTVSESGRTCSAVFFCRRRRKRCGPSGCCQCGGDCGGGKTNGNKRTSTWMKSSTVASGNCLSDNLCMRNARNKFAYKQLF